MMDTGAQVSTPTAVPTGFSITIPGKMYEDYTVQWLDES